MDSSDLFTPTIDEFPGPAPFDPGSFLYPAFFGGVGALAWVAAVNAFRLPDVRSLRKATWIAVAVGAVATIGVLLFGRASWFVSTSSTRLILRVVAVAAAVPVIAAQRAGERIAMQRFDQHSSLWRLGITATLVAGAAQAVLVTAILNARGIW